MLEDIRSRFSKQEWGINFVIAVAGLLSLIFIWCLFHPGESKPTINTDPPQVRAMKGIAENYQCIGKNHTYVQIDEDGKMAYYDQHINRSSGEEITKILKKGHVEWKKNRSYDLTEEDGKRHEIQLRGGDNCMVITDPSDSSLIWVCIDRTHIYEEVNDELSK